jgi:tRNA pseudouridine55 synthase
MSSTQAVGKVRWLYNAEKAGHAGTLDPLATGLLPIALGEATKTVPFVQGGGKRYSFDLEWASATSTDDAEGEVVATSDVRPSEAEVLAALPAFTGTIMQRPPAFSAIKVDGERAYDLARSGQAVELAARPVTIDELTLVSHSPERSRFDMACEKGTYVRSLARDLAEALGTRGHVTMLRRTGSPASPKPMRSAPIVMRCCAHPPSLCATSPSFSSRPKMQRSSAMAGSYYCAVPEPPSPSPTPGPASTAQPSPSAA